MTSKAEIKDRVLTENTAQGVVNHLRELKSNRARMQRRWIWELLQNARDVAAADDTHVVASVEFGNGALVFQHNGRGFTKEEVAYLIYHGSTKLEDINTIGQLISLLSGTLCRCFTSDRGSTWQETSTADIRDQREPATRSGWSRVSPLG